MHSNFVNAQEMARQHPDTFQAPAADGLAALKKGDFVKVCIARERFWVEVTDVPTNRAPDVVGKVRNDLLNVIVHGYNNDDDITFGLHNVLSISKAETAVKVVSEVANIAIVHAGCNDRSR